MIQVINNFLNNDKFHSIYNIITSSNFPWYFPENGKTNFTHDIVKKTQDKVKTSFWVTPILSPLLQEFQNINKKISDMQLTKAKIDLTYRTNEIVENEPSVDVSKIDLNEPTETAILYLNTNDGYTQIVGSNKIESVQNRILILPTNTSYFETTTTDNDFRLVLKLVYKV